MSDKKNIDRLFQERFKNFEAAPSDAVWSRIEAQLQQKKKKRRVIPIWWRYAGAAAILLLLLAIGNGFLGEPSHVIPSTNVVETDATTRSKSSEKGTTSNQTTNVLDADNIIVTENTSENTTSSSASKLAETDSDTNENESENVSNSSLKRGSNALTTSENHVVISNHSENRNNNNIPKESFETNKSKEVLNSHVTDNPAIAESSTEENIKLQKETSLDKTKADTVINNIKKNTAVAETKDIESNDVTENKGEKKIPTIEDVINETKNIIEEEEERLNRWSVTPNAAPVYFNTLGEGSSIDGQFNNNTKTAEANMSYGITASYAVNKKLRIRSGINKVNLGYNTNNVVVYETLAKSSSSSIISSANTEKTRSVNTNTNSNVTLLSAENFESNDAVSLVSNSNTSINQSFAYIEVPLEIQYTLSDKKIGVNLIGGFSSFFLSDNELFSQIEGARTSIGEANNINKVSYSANLGLGFQYKFTKKLNLNLEPMFKYQINTFNNTSGNFTPYFIGVYTGIGFKF